MQQRNWALVQPDARGAMAKLSGVSNGGMSHAPGAFPGNQRIEGPAQFHRPAAQSTVEEIALRGIEEGGRNLEMRVVVEEGPVFWIGQAEFAEYEAGILRYDR